MKKFQTWPKVVSDFALEITAGLDYDAVQFSDSSGPSCARTMPVVSVRVRIGQGLSAVASTQLLNE